MSGSRDVVVRDRSSIAAATSAATLSRRAWWTAAIYIATAALLLRFYDLPLKPLHHDEGVNTLILTPLVQSPHVYRYDPANYHGPTLYYFTWLSVSLLQMTTVAIRFATATFGFATVLLLFGLRRQIGCIGALAAASLLAVSPGAVYFSRYFIHETLLVCFTVAMVVGGAAWLESHRARWLLLAAASAGLMFATKETAIISAAVLVGAAVGATVLAEFRRIRREHDTQESPARQLVTVLSSTAQTILGELGQRKHAPLLATAVGVFITVNVLFYTSFFTHWQGAIDAVESFALWTKTGVSDHTRPWYTYLNWLSREELPLLVLSAAGGIWALWRSDNRFAVFATLWAIGMLAAYAIIPYKTPWLALNMIAPLVMVGGYASEVIWQHRHVLPRMIPAVGAIVVGGTATYQAGVLNFVQYDDARHPYVYVHTSREVLELVRQIGRFEQLNPGASIAITSRDHFPLSWYLRSYHAGFYGRTVVTNDPLVVGSEEQQAALDVLLGNRFERVGSYRLRPGVQLMLYVRRDLRRPSPESP